jgi:outer membrane protein OmpA-like peptidoglycan-associated protein
MNSRILTHIIIPFLMLSFCAVHAQKQKDIDKADYYYDLYMYSKAIPFFEKYNSKITNDSTNLKNLYKQAIAYKKTHQYEASTKTFLRMLKCDTNRVKYNIALSQNLIKLKQYDKALKYLRKYLAIYPNDKFALNLFESVKSIPDLSVDRNMYTLENLNINTDKADFGAVKYKNGIVFSSSGYPNTFSKNYPRNNESYLDLYYTEPSGQNEFSEFDRPRNFSKIVNSKFHDGPIHFYDNEKQCIVSQNYYNKGEDYDNPEKTNILALFHFKTNDLAFKFDKNFQFNRKGFSVGHAFISDELKMMFFISDKPGGYGGTDIYVCRYKNGQWTNPTNLGNRINTPGNEMFPFVYKNQLYFSSDGHVGMGGLDIFVSSFDQYFWSFPNNLKAPINSEKDDFAYYLLDKEEDKGFFSSNRDGGKGGDDIYLFKGKENFYKELNILVFDAKSKTKLEGVELIYHDENGIKQSETTSNKGLVKQKFNPFINYEFVLNKTNYHTKKFLYFFENQIDNFKDTLKIYLEPEQWLKLEGTVAEKSNKSPIDSAQVRINNLTYQIYTDIYSDKKGTFEFSLDPNCKYQIFINKEGYFNEEVKQVSTIDIDGSKTFRYDLLLDLDKIELGKAIVLKKIYYDTDKWNIKPQSKIELNKVVDMLTNNPYIKIELSSHTDSRAGDQYNLILSKKRAKSAYEYIISKGISADRITYEGYGERRLQNHCKNGVKCSEKEHQANRRTEIKVLEY